MSAIEGRRPTAVDVGREAGVSRATVGYVLNGVAGQTIPTATRERVLAAATRLGYTPSASARSLRAGRSEVVLCLIPDWPIGSSFTAQTTAISAALEPRGFTFLTHPYSAANRPLAEVLRAVTPAVVLTLAELSDDDRRVLDAARIRVVPFRGRAADGGVRIGRLQAGHLIERGCTRLAIVSPTDPRLRHTFAEGRARGARAEAAERGTPVTADRVPLTAQGFRDAVARWAAAGVDGVCCYNDEYGIGVLAAAAAAGLDVPGRLAVIGVDDDPLAAVVQPGLSTVAVAPAAAADGLARQLVGEPAGPPASIRIVERRSTGAVERAS